MEDLSNYEKLKEDAQNFYNNIHKVFSPALNQDIYFNSEGFNHIVFKGSRSEKERPSQMLRFKLLHLAVKLVKLPTTYQEFEETLKEFEVKSHKKRIRKSKPVRYWGIIAIIDSRKIKVILRQIGDGGAMHFWSIVPAWTTNKYRDAKFYTTMKGSPDED
ncbi:hypothetical protein CO033_00335 [Candidatus Nomurabacteria bacterium CG_4_9_14_0_2_um_filter_32_10]|uniref:Phage-Barnase-EndoU-ColicinE5/D-RelE like nuclease 2 domain-containing protein n=3 Tax=Candidatus Nomuraibacteriota TaxID=1752729 RepID=A0A2H0CHC4_9BACT|nr:MAG: hypothetical protein COW91_03090 [Candidatus Nomurabacteria bacterium CG22_combo_CG10-13_8_21_14_all_32_8]PIZ85980.1 MAG: hypothetical protein COX94_01375 [Candidatus Nomurabacteria bacterium CG_4_10_14_0_2_um_filter_33_9]PJC49660.1 MAG: hypothetical protein CO033_00335 [Candidatus Nomurabacteria bacterium CG_4_9_14_0_2_um_filter_32_10]